jgi:hypothetical protein
VGHTMVMEETNMSNRYLHIRQFKALSPPPSEPQSQRAYASHTSVATGIGSKATLLYAGAPTCL